MIGSKRWPGETRRDESGLDRLIAASLVDWLGRLVVLESMGRSDPFQSGFAPGASFWRRHKGMDSAMTGSSSRRATIQPSETRPRRRPTPLVAVPVMKRNSEIQKIAFVGDYLPRKCGIATFTYDVCTSVATQYPGSDCFVVPINDIAQGYEYPAEARFEIEEQELDSYLRAADFLNFANTDIVCLQHEFGIFGGPAGSHVVRLLRDLRMPIVTTLHTVLKEPSTEQHRVLRQVAELSARAGCDVGASPDLSRRCLRRSGRQDRLDRPRHPRHAVRRPQLLQGSVRRRGQVRRADLRAACRRTKGSS